MKLIYEDEWIIAVNKPAGLPCHPLAPHKDSKEDTTLQRLAQLRPEVMLPDFEADDPDYVGISREGGLLHRLDNATSGVLLCAKTVEAYKLFRDLIRGQGGGCVKQYAAVVSGRIPDDIREISWPIAHDRNRKSGRMHAVRVRGAGGAWRGRPRAAQTLILKCQHREGNSVCLLQIRRGQRHQIRCHLAAIGHPVLGDELYGRSAQPAPALELSLHHWRIRFVHPVMKDDTVIEAEIPQRIGSPLFWAAQTQAW